MFMDLLCQFDSRNDLTRVIKSLEPQHWLQTGLHPSMVLLHDVVQVLTRANFDRIRSAEVKLPSHSHPSQRGVAGFMPVQRDAVGMRPRFECLAKESLGRGNASRSAEEKLNGIPLPVNGPVQIHPLP